jgi:lipooligosaccharide transport system permease protein
MSRFLVDLLAVGDWRSRVVLGRNARVYLRNWRTAFFPPALEPLLFFVAFGLGLGSYVGDLEYAGREVSYATWVAPGLLTYTAFTTAFYEGLYSAYVRMFYQKTFDGILATQVEMRHIVWGEVLWCGLRGMMNAAVVSVVLVLCQLFGLVAIDLGALVLVAPLVFVVGWAFGAFALVFTAIVPSIDHMNYPVFVIGVPLSLLSDTYFPVPTENPIVRTLLALNPVYYFVDAARALLLDGPAGGPLLALFVATAVFLVVTITLAHRLMHRRLLGE